MRRLITLSALSTLLLFCWSCSKENLAPVATPQLSLEESAQAYLNQIREDVVFQVNYYDIRSNTHSGWSINNLGEIGTYTNIQPPSLHPEYPTHTYDQFLQMAERNSLTGIFVDTKTFTDFHKATVQMEYAFFSDKPNPNFEEEGVIVSFHTYRDESPRGVECDTRDRVILLHSVGENILSNYNSNAMPIVSWLKDLEAAHGLSN